MGDALKEWGKIQGSAKQAFARSVDNLKSGMRAGAAEAGDALILLGLQADLGYLRSRTEIGKVLKSEHEAARTWDNMGAMEACKRIAERLGVDVGLTEENTDG